MAAATMPRAEAPHAPPPSPPASPPSPAAAPPGATSAALPLVTSAELRAHASAGDLWVAVHGGVYDVTAWLPRHPGGEHLLLSLAGQDVTDPFLAFHPPGTVNVLAQFHVAALADYSVSALSADYRRTLANFRSSGMFRKDPFFYVGLSVVLFVVFLLCIAGVLLCESFLVHGVSAVLLGFFWTHSSYVMHDHAHSPFLGRPRLDASLQIFVACCLTGLSPSWWKRSHNAHHVSTNLLAFDPDLQFLPLFAVSSKFFSSIYSHFHRRRMAFDGLARWLVSYQHWSFYPVLLVARINLLAQAFVFFLSKQKIRYRAMEIVGIACFWAWFLALLTCLPNTTQRLTFLLVSSGTTAIQHLQFCLNHFPCEVSDEDPPKCTEYLESQVRATLNISCPSWIDWFHGGLQFQVEHHLFPHLPRHNLRKVSGVVKALCEKHDLPYVSVGFWEANVMLVRTLRTAALQARDLRRPVPKNLVWEAVNAQG